ncbi:MAG: N-acetylmuramoyl-L-alanine amidase [Myxococcales bacterium]|nr:N-acetylmuramoyl-L-alanine amidase [Myxococcales bacterium]
MSDRSSRPSRSLRAFASTPSLLLAAALAAGSCVPSPAERAQAVVRDVQSARTLGAAIDSAAEGFGVPREVLLALSHAESGWGGPSEQDEHAGEPGSLHAPAEVGPMHLRHGAGFDSIARAIALLQTTDQELRANLGLQVAGAAAVLAELGEQTGARPDNVDSWARAVAKYSGLVGESVQADYADRVWHGIRHGLRERVFTGETLELSPTPGPTARELIGVSQTSQASTDYGPALWVPASTSNYSGTRSGRVQFIVIHTMQGSYSGSISWFQNPSAQASAHYMVRSSDGQITQMVRESANAWHAGNSYLNNNSIGIEHEGFVMDPGRWYTDAMYMASARLTRMLCDRYGVPIDRAHIIGHYQVPRSGSGAPCGVTATTCGGAGGHTDPGNGGTQWDWDRFLTMVRNNGTAPPPVPAYDATLVGSSYPMTAEPGTRPVAWVEYRNTGSATWDVTNTRLGTTGPRDRSSPFFDMVNWVNASRPSAVDRATAPGAVGRFSFVLNIPNVATETMYTETFGLVQEGRTWFGPADNAVSFRIRVVPPIAPRPDGGAPTDSGVAPAMDSGAGDPPADGGGERPAPIDSGVGAEDGGSGVPLPGDSGPPRADSGVARDTGTVRDPSGCGCSTVGTSAIDPRALSVVALGFAAMLGRRRKR